MKLFASVSEVCVLDTALAASVGAARVPVLVEMAWQLRQADSTRAASLAAEAQRLLDAHPSDAPDHRRCQARLSLVRCELAMLVLSLDVAQAQGMAALAVFVAINDAVGEGDSQVMLALLSQQRSQQEARDAQLYHAFLAYRRAGDAARVDAVLARSIYFATDVGLANRRLAQCFPADPNPQPALEAWVAGARAFATGEVGDSVPAVRYFLQSYHAALETGQLRLALMAGTNAAEAFANMGALDAALEWITHVLPLARAAGWPHVMGSALVQLGNVLGQLGRGQEARAVLLEAMALTASIEASQVGAEARILLGDLCLASGAPEEALGYFNVAAQRRISMSSEPELMRGLRRQSHALCRLARTREALEKMQQATLLAQRLGHAEEQIRLLRIRAELHQQDASLPVPLGLAPGNPVTQCLRQAVAIATTLPGYQVPADLLDELAAACEAQGEYQEALHHAKAATAAHASSRLREARNLAIAFEVQNQTRRARADADHQRELAQTESRRAEALQQAAATLETLSHMGRELTASLSAPSVVETLYRHVKHMLDVTSFVVYVVTPDGLTLDGVFGFEFERPLTLLPIPLDSPTSAIARCARARQDVLIEREVNEARQHCLTGTVPTQSQLFSPLLAGERLLGVMSIQTVVPHAYGERERAILRTLSAYGAIALDNAAAYERAERARQHADEALARLRQAQAQLLVSEKQAALGRLVAGVAHELNTPLGNGLMAISSLRDELGTFKAAVAGGGLKRLTFEKFLAYTDMASELAQRSLARGAALVESFKQLGLDRDLAPRHSFVLRDVMAAVAAHAAHRLADTPYRLTVQPLAHELHMEGYASVLIEVLTSLIDNAVVHGFEGRTQGLISLSAVSMQHDRLRIVVQDDGCGIATEHLGRVFDAFFTTRLGQGSCGLGLHLAFNKVTQTLGGTLVVRSHGARGTAFELLLPRVVPE